MKLRPDDYDLRLKYERDFAAMVKELLTKSFAGQGIWTGDVTLSDGAASHEFDVLLMGKALNVPDVKIIIKAKRPTP